MNIVDFAAFLVRAGLASAPEVFSIISGNVKGVVSVPNGVFGVIAVFTFVDKVFGCCPYWRSFYFGAKFFVYRSLATKS